MVTNIHQRIIHASSASASPAPTAPLALHIRALRRFGPKRLKAFRPLGITPQELEAMLFDPSLR